MAGVTVNKLANGRFDVNCTGFSPEFTGICPYVSTLRFRKRVDGKSIDVVYDDETVLTICAHTDGPLVGVLPVEFLDGVEMTTQTILYNALKIL